MFVFCYCFHFLFQCCKSRTTKTLCQAPKRACLSSRKVGKKQTIGFQFVIKSESNRCLWCCLCRDGVHTVSTGCFFISTSPNPSRCCRCPTSHCHCPSCCRCPSRNRRYGSLSHTNRTLRTIYPYGGRIGSPLRFCP